jgi:hypothetical protein
MSAPEYLNPKTWFDLIFAPQSAFIVIVVALGVLLLISFGANYKGATSASNYGKFGLNANPSPLVQRSVQRPAVVAPPAPAAPAAVKPAAKAPLLAPKVFKVEPQALEQKKTLSDVKTEKKPVLEPKMILPPTTVVAPVVAEEVPSIVAAEVMPVVAAAPSKLDSTYEAYRNAMLNSGPRGQLEASKLQTKAGNTLWREQARSLKLPDSDTAAFLERTNVSVNDRMVAIFDAVKA